MTQEKRYLDMSKQAQVIRKSNELIEARYRLSVNEQRLVYTLLSLIHPEDEDFKDYIIKIDDLAKMFELEKSNNTYERIQEASKELLNRMISLPDYENPKRRRFLHWFSYVEYIEGQGEIKVSFHKELKPYLLRLKEHFTQYQLPSIAKFRGQYSARFYELLKRREYQGDGGQFWVKYSILELRMILDIPDNEYALFGDFRRKVIEPAIKEIQEFSDLKIVDCQYLKTGRKFTDIKIYAEPKSAKERQADEAQMELELLAEQEAQPINEAVDALLALGISEDTARKWARKFGKGRILRNVAYTLAMKEAGQVKSPILYLSKAIEQDYGKGWEDERQKQQEAQKEAKKRERTKEQEDEEKREREKKEREETLSKFSALSETEKEAVRDMYAQTLKGVILSKWRKAGDEPEKEGFLSVTFALYLRENELV